MLVSCGSALWNRPVETLKNEWANGDTTFLLSLSTAQLKGADLGALGPGAAWNLGHVFAQAHRWDEARLLWEKSLQNDPSPWRQAAGKDLYDLAAGDRDWPKAEALARRVLADSDSPWAQRQLFEALYFQKKDAPAQAIFAKWKSGQFTPAEETENRLFAAVLAYRAGDLATASAGLRALVFDEPASVLQFRLQSFFEEDPTRYELLGPWGKETVTFQSLAYQAVPAPLLDWLAKTKLPTGFWNHRALIETFEGLFKTEGRAETGLRMLEKFRQHVTGEARFAAEYARGRLYRAVNRWIEARVAFQNALPLAPTTADYQKTSWNWLNSWVSLEPSSALGPFLQVYGQTSDPSYFHDVLETWITSLVQDRNWKLLTAAWRDLGHRLPAEDQATLGFVLSRLAAGGFVDLAGYGINATPIDLLARALESSPTSYEGIVARAVLGREVEWPKDSHFELAAEQRDRQVLWEGLLAYGLGRLVVDQALASVAPLDPEFVLRTAKVLQARGLYRPSLLLVYRLLKDDGAVLTQPMAHLLYPQAFASIVEAQARRQNLDPNLLWGLMREESSFDPVAKSWVGAQGLTQLMPVTAAETAKRLKMKSYDLAKPEDNLALGAAYLATMVRSQQQIFLALMAYNAGGGRIKPWKAELGRLPVEIFVEAAPISETRDYVKRILVSTVMYGVLHGKTLGEMVKLVYPNLQP
jgi:tetratricopeptide (TPR) repeat protein